MKNKEMLWKNNGVKIHPKIKIVGQVYINDYGELEAALGQRDLDPMGVGQLRGSISEFGLCSCPIVVKEKSKYVVVDGWHRVASARKEETDIICTLIEPQCSINEVMIILNTTQRNWKLEAYLNNGIVYHKNPDYTVLNEIYKGNDNSASLGVLYEIYSHDTKASKRKELFERGVYKITSKPIGDKTLRCAAEINKYVPFSYKSNFLRALVKCVSKKGFKRSHLINQLKKYPAHIVDSGDSSALTLNMLNKVYNNCCLEEEQLYLGDHKGGK